MLITPGVYHGMKNADYHGAKDWLGSTSIKTLAMRTPAHFKHEQANPERKDAYDIGTLAHGLTLEGDESLHVVIDVPDKRGNKWTVPADEARAEGKIPVTTAEWAAIVGMRDSIMAHPLARNAFTGHKAEQSVFHVDDGLQVKIRPDAYKPGLITDLKTTVSADPNEFRRTAYSLGYFISAAMYTDVWKAATSEDAAFAFVLVEKTAPYLVSVVELDAEALDYGRHMVERGKRIYRQCTDKGEWPGYQPFTTVGLPKYATYELEEILENE